MSSLPAPTLPPPRPPVLSQGRRLEQRFHCSLGQGMGWPSPPTPSEPTPHSHGYQAPAGIIQGMLGGCGAGGTAQDGLTRLGGDNFNLCLQTEGEMSTQAAGPAALAVGRVGSGHPASPGLTEPTVVVSPCPVNWSFPNTRGCSCSDC